jgi:hypothetical protein
MNQPNQKNSRKNWIFRLKSHLTPSWKYPPFWNISLNKNRVFLELVGIFLAFDVCENFEYLSNYRRFCESRFIFTKIGLIDSYRHLGFFFVNLNGNFYLVQQIKRTDFFRMTLKIGYLAAKIWFVRFCSPFWILPPS